MTILARERERLVAEVQSTSGFDDRTVSELFEIYQTYYTSAHPDIFCRDFFSKHHVILLRDHNGLVRGFSTIMSWCADTATGPVRFLFSGDTIIERAFWGTQALPLKLLEYAGTIKAADPVHQLYWLLITKGHRTYRLMSAFAHRFFPSRREDTPDDIQALMRLAGKRQFGGAYCEETGIVSLVDDRSALKAEYDSDRRKNPEASFFVLKNPHYRDGDELLCLCALEYDNLRAPARTQFLKGFYSGDTNIVMGMLTQGGPS